MIREDLNRCFGAFPTGNKSPMESSLVLVVTHEAYIMMLMRLIKLMDGSGGVGG